MRVLVIGHSYMVGFNQLKFEAIARMGIDVGLLVPGNWKHIGGLFDGQPCPVEKPFPSLQIFEGTVIRPGHIASFLFAPGVVRRVLRDFLPDLVQIEQEVFSFAAAQVSFAAKAIGAKVVLFSWENLDRRVHLFQRIARRVAVRKIDGIIAGNRAGEALMRKWGFSGKTAVIPQVGVDTAAFAPRCRAPAARPTVGFVGRLVPEKDVATLLRASALLVQRGGDFDLLICGAGPESDALKREAGELGIASRITWQESVPHAEVPGVMARMDLLVLPSLQISSWSEQFGLVLPQAMAMGIPVLGSDSGAIPEVIGRADAIFPERDAAALAVLMDGVLGSPARRNELREHGLARVDALYSKQRVAEHTVEFWKLVANTADALA